MLDPGDPGKKRLRVWSLRDLGSWSGFSGAGISLLNSTQMGVQIPMGLGFSRSLCPRVSLWEGLESLELSVNGLVLCGDASSWGPSPRGSGVSESGSQTPYLWEVPVGLESQGRFCDAAQTRGCGGPAGRSTLTCRRRR